MTRESVMLSACMCVHMYVSHMYACDVCMSRRYLYSQQCIAANNALCVGVRPRKRHKSSKATAWQMTHTHHTNTQPINQVSVGKRMNNESLSSNQQQPQPQQQHTDTTQTPHIQHTQAPHAPSTHVHRQCLYARDGEGRVWCIADMWS